MIDRIVNAVVATTGEVLEYHVSTPDELTRAYKDVQAHLDAYRLIKNTLLNTSMEMHNQPHGKEQDGSELHDNPI